LAWKIRKLNIQNPITTNTPPTKWLNVKGFGKKKKDKRIVVNFLIVVTAVATPESYRCTNSITKRTPM